MVARTKAIPSPVGGWNARDSYADMPPTDAVLLENWFPSEGAVNLRKGYSNHQTGLGDWVETLMVYHNGTTEQLLAAADGNIRNVTSGTTSLASGFSENKWQYATLGGTMGLVNGTDAPRTYDGSTLGTMTLTGPTAANVIGVAVHGSRSYFWEDDSQSFWYSALNTMGGTVTEFDLGNVANIAGELVEVTNWTHDGGDGADDYLVFLFSEGDVLIYQGTDPGSAADFAKIGAYRIAQPLGRRCAMSLGGDVVLMTTDGYVLLSEVMRRRQPSLGAKIAPAVSSAASIYKSLDGWEMVNFPAANMAIFNVPTSATMMCQHVLNTNTGAWCKFTGWNARCWALFNDLVYFGGNGIVARAWNGTSDNGTAISADAVPAFNYFGGGNLKQVTAIQQTLTANGTLDIGVTTEKDFVLGAKPIANLSTGSSSSPWGSAWGSPWSRTAEVFTPIKTVTSVGRALTGRLVTQTTNHSVAWYSTNYFYETGGFI